MQQFACVDNHVDAVIARLQSTVKSGNYKSILNGYNRQLVRTGGMILMSIAETIYQHVKALEVLHFVEFLEAKQSIEKKHRILFNTKRKAIFSTS